MEDERHLAEALCQILKKNNYTADAVYNGEAGLDYSMSNIYDAVILDIMLPKMDGISVLKALRAQKNDTPVLLLTAKGDIADKVRGLDSGADDYLAKPFNTDELLARIRALTRRRGEIVKENAMDCGDLSLDRNTMSVAKDGKSINLTLKEFELLEFLAARKTMITPKELIIEKIWGFDSDAEANHVEVYVSFLRKKLSYIHSIVRIETVRGVGYVLKWEE